MTIFENLVYNEDTFTELLRNFLSIKVFRDACLEMLQLNIECDEIEESHFETQVHTRNGRPDLVICNDKYDLFFEIKVRNTKLTYNQPNGYLKELKLSKKPLRALILITPRHYYYKNDYENALGKGVEGICSKTITWNDLIHQIEKKELSQHNPLLAEFEKLLKEWFEPRLVELTPKTVKYMYSIELPKAISDITAIIDETKLLLPEDVKTKSNTRNFLVEYGFYIENVYEIDFYFGQWFEYWSEKGRPLCLCVYSDKKKLITRFLDCAEKAGLPKAEKFINDWYVTYFDTNYLNVGSDDSGSQKIANKIIEVKNLFEKMR